MISQGEIDALKFRNSILEVSIRLGVLDDKYFNSKNRVSIKCPFHEDHHPSFTLYPETNTFFCFGCQATGDIISLVSKVKNVGFIDAIKWIDPTVVHESSSPINYLRDKGITQETAGKVGLVITTCLHKNVWVPAILIPTPGGKKYRIFSRDRQKYSFAPGQKISLYKLNGEGDDVYLVEGEMDAIKLWQETNYKYNCWTSTGGVSNFQDEWCQDFINFKRIIVGYDNDDEGKHGAIKTINTLIKGGISREKIVQIEVPAPELFGKDWCEYFKKGMTKKNFDELIKDALDKGIKP